MALDDYNSQFLCPDQSIYDWKKHLKKVSEDNKSLGIAFYFKIKSLTEKINDDLDTIIRK